MIIFTQQVRSLPSPLYGTPKIHKIKENSDIPSLMPIVSSINSYNYNLASYLCQLLTHFIPTAYYTKDSFTFIKDTDIAVKLILQNKKVLKFSKNELTKFFVLLRRKVISFLMRKSSIKLME